MADATLEAAQVVKQPQGLDYHRRAATCNARQRKDKMIPCSKLIWNLLNMKMMVSDDWTIGTVTGYSIRFIVPFKSLPPTYLLPYSA